MKLTELTLINFRRFKELMIEFHPELTVIAAKNGQGKTSVLDAATVALGTFVGAFDLGKAKHLDHNDARYHRQESMSDSEQIFPVRVEAKLSNIHQTIVRELTGAKSKTTIKGASALTAYGKNLMDRVRNLDSVELPVMAYYGSGRLWNTHKNMSRKAVLSESRTMGYEDCFTSASSFTQVQQWMNKATFAALQQQTIGAYSSYNIDDQIKGIQKTVNTVLREESWNNFHYSVQHEELAMTHEELGVLPVSMLSDGVRAMVSMIADLAWRCAKLNPQMGANAQQQTNGIVFIDEVDMHLHPKWQQTVVGSLQDAFPKVQFVLTTHSPQVLSTVKSESIRLIRHEFDQGSNEWTSESITPSMQSRGVASSNVMATLQGIDPVPDVEESDWIKDYKVLIDRNQQESEEGKTLKTKILDHFGSNHHEWLECQRLIRLQAMKAKVIRKQGTRD